jgi:cytochrome b6-f complex iron-sulfur subunit
MSKNFKEKKSQIEPPRRSFLNKLWLSLGVIALAEFVWLVIAFLRPRKPRAKAGDFGTIIEAGAVDNFATGTVTAFARGHFYLSRLEDGGFLAISRRCTHLGCTVPWVEKEKNFVCPCHASTFDIRGNVINSPAPRALDIYRIVIENNVVKVNTSNPIRRTEFRKEQVVYPKKT